MTVQLTIDIWSDFSCLWCWFGKNRLEKALEDLGVDAALTVHSFLIDPAGPDRSIPSLDNLSSKAGVSREEAREMEEGMQRQALGEGFSYAVERHHTNGIDAHRVVHLAREYGQAEALFADLQTALFSHGSDIYNHALLVDAAAQRGVPRERATHVVEGDAYAENVHLDVTEAKRRGIRAVPHVLLNDRLAVPGATSVEGYRSAIEKATGA